MSDADGIVLEALLDDVLDLSLIRDAIDEALELVCGQTVDDPREQVETELANVNRERDRLVASIAAGGELAGLLEALRTREEHRASLEVERRSIAARQRTQATDATRVREELTDLAGRWRKVLAGDPEHARPILSRLLVGRVTFTPIERHRWEMKGEGTLAGLFTRELFPSVWRPQRVRPHYARLWSGGPSHKSQRSGPRLGFLKLGDREYDLRNRFCTLQARVFKQQHAEPAKIFPKIERPV